MKPSTILALVALAAVAFGRPSQAHGGHFHGPDTPASRGYPFVVIKQCSNWLRRAGAARIPGASNARLMGSTHVQYYYYKNCSSSASSSVQLTVNLTGTVGGRMDVPLRNVTFAGAVLNRPCVDVKTSGARLYNLRNSRDPLDKGNYLWWSAATTGELGNITGHGANNGKPRGVEGQIRSVVLFLNSHGDHGHRAAGGDDDDHDEGSDLVEDLDAWRSKVAFCCNLGGPNAIVNRDWATALEGLPGTDC